MDDQIFSASSIGTFLRCPKQWEYAYVYALPGEQNIRQLVGIAVHEAIEVNYRQKIDSGQDLPQADVVAAFERSYDAGIEGAAPDPKETPEQGRTSGAACVRTYLDDVAAHVQPVWVEREIQFRIDGIPYGGTIDLVDDVGRIRDLKTAKKRPGQETPYALAMTGYALGYRKETGELETEIVLDYIVRTKTPYYWPVTSGPLTNGAIGHFADVLGEINQQVKRGDFPALGPENHACSWCPYRQICPDFPKSMLF